MVYDPSSSYIVQATGELLIDLGYAGSIVDANFGQTPERWAKWLYEFRRIDVEEEIRTILTPIFPEAHEELVIVKNIGFVSMCAHHVLPFHGRAHVGYVPRNGVVGISKLARVVKVAAKQLTLQERITRQVADAVYDVLGCQGVMVVMEASHACMSFRGIEDEHASTTTSAVRGIFAENKDGIKDEFLRLISR